MAPINPERIFNTQPSIATRREDPKVLNNYRVWSRFRELSLGRRARPQNLNSNYIIIYIKYRLAATNKAANPKLISVFPPAPVYG